MSDANVRIPSEARDRLAEVAAGEGLSLCAYLARLADTLLTPGEGQNRLNGPVPPMEWSGYAPSDSEQRQADAELDRRLHQALTR